MSHATHATPTLTPENDYERMIDRARRRLMRIDPEQAFYLTCQMAAARCRYPKNRTEAQAILAWWRSRATRQAQG